MSTHRLQCWLDRAHEPCSAGLAALALSVLLAGCGGGGSGSASGSGSGSGSGGGGGSSGAAMTYYLSGAAGGGNSGNGSPSLIAINPASGAQSQLAATGSWSDQAAVGQWTAGSAGATAVGTRFRVFADANNALHSADLSGSLAAPASVQLSNASTASFCPMQAGMPPSAPTVLDDYANPANSLLVYRGGTCGTPTDVFTIVPLSAGASTTLAAASLTEPVDAVRNSSGGLATLLLLVHGATSAQVAYASSASAAPTVIGTLTGAGNSASGGDFQSLAVVPQSDGSAYWIWRDQSMVKAARIPAPGSNATTPTIIPVYQALDTDTLLAPAIVDGSKVYLGLADTTNPSNIIVAVDTTAIGGTAPAWSNVLTETVPGHIGIRLVGLLGANLYYEYTDQSALRYVAKTAAAATSGTVLWSAPAPNAAGLSLDYNYAPVIVPGGIYYCVTGNGTPMAQAYFYNGSGTPAPIGAAGSQVLGGVAGSPLNIASVAAPAYGGAVVAVFSTAATSNSPMSAATLDFYDGAGQPTLLGTLPTPAKAYFQSLSVGPGLLQSGMPTVLTLGGYAPDPLAAQANDLFVFVPAGAGSLQRITTNLQ